MVADGGEQAIVSEYGQDSYYLVRRTLAFFWPHDESGKMIGEYVYADAEKTVTKVETSDRITGLRATELFAPIIDR